MRNYRFPTFQEGINNVNRAEKVSSAGLTAGVNVDLVGASVKRRAGRTLVQSGTNVHSVYAYGDYAYAVDNGELKRWSDLPGQGVTVALGVLGPLSYAEIGNVLVWSGPGSSGAVQIDGTLIEFGIDAVNRQPVAEALPGGAWNAGHVMIAITAVKDGLESGTTEAVYLDLQEGSNIQLSNFVDMGQDYFNVYVSDPDGETLYFRAEVNGAGPVVLPYLPPKRALATQFTDKLPIGGLVATHNGFLLAASGRFWYYSEGQKYWSHSPHHHLQ